MLSHTANTTDESPASCMRHRMPCRLQTPAFVSAATVLLPQHHPATSRHPAKTAWQLLDCLHLLPICTAADAASTTVPADTCPKSMQLPSAHNRVTTTAKLPSVLGHHLCSGS